jgi:hypothetical protein
MRTSPVAAAVHDAASAMAPLWPSRGDRPMSSRSLIVAIPLLIVAGGAHAECKFSPFSFFPDRNDVVHVQVTAPPNSFCDNSFREGPGYSFTKVTVVKPPPHGLVATLGPNHYAYHALPGYTGGDQYMIRACAKVGARSGCSTLIYDVTVE